MVNIKKYQSSDLEELISLFFQTVHTINKQDYTGEQLAAWAPEEERETMAASWGASLSRNISFKAIKDGRIAGFADMTIAGHLDRLYVHKEFQRQGIASALAAALESEALKFGIKLMDTDASITARPFFEHIGYQVEKERCILKNGVELINYRMMKRIQKN
ncbi:GNAT family N-acetyltransferase [Metabacillus sp. GX 13764]|uniref:GNAT family N-acetyltransferase n=1 Tax=Metabacillus kandeliae TaxID=2900151 RepID=UPI001E554DC8|nr:GNAT family N-acetyltransferase [Metabacillus kandeliae]MCD7036239.1 GNAT family N-acetyltransferase [Metabacillus kandeliae]